MTTTKTAENRINNTINVLKTFVTKFYLTEEIGNTRFRKKQLSRRKTGISLTNGNK